MSKDFDRFSFYIFKCLVRAAAIAGELVWGMMISLLTRGITVIDRTRETDVLYLMGITMSHRLTHSKISQFWFKLVNSNTQSLHCRRNWFWIVSASTKCLIGTRFYNLYDTHSIVQEEMFLRVMNFVCLDLIGLGRSNTLCLLVSFEAC